VPGCQAKAIRSHSIPRAAIAEALAESGQLYTLRQSFMSIVEQSSPSDPMIVDEVGVNQAGTFDGFCPAHDSHGFKSIERLDEPHKFSVIAPLDFRARSLEYGRKRTNFDFFKRLAELTTDDSAKAIFQAQAELYERTCLQFGDTFIGNAVRMLRGDPQAPAEGKVEYFCMPIARNLEVSCCGCFHLDMSDHNSTATYTLISYADMSVLLLTTYQSSKEKFYAFAHETGPEKLLNEIAFSRGEEPLIGARLWRSLSEEQQLAVRLSLCHPDYRVTSEVPQIIKLGKDDGFLEMTPELWQRLRLFDNLNPQRPDAPIAG